MSYMQALELAGAEVLEFAQFGNYSGDWWAKVIFNDIEGWVYGHYGSCPHCDLLKRHAPRWDYEDQQGSEKAYDEYLCNFGRSYLLDLLDQEEAERIASENLEWDSNAQDIIDFLKQNAIL